jgi:CheY-like chemotaxis protein
MATGKRALIVDDSRSARVILSRMLEQHGMTVDTAESAEQALEYLQQSRPDVIFMDHLMPGMDGFQAVQEIKSDPQTALIPLMMYTSQEGELYVSQARALGAIGVLPKTVRPVDVSRVLYQLNLLPERRTQRSALFDAAAAAAHAAAQHSAGEAAAHADAAHATGAPAAASLPLGSAAPRVASPQATVSPALFAEMQAGLRQSTQQLVKDQLGEQRRFVLATFEAFARRLSNEIKEGLARVPVVPPVIESSQPPPSRRQWWPVALTALLAVVPAIILGWLYWQTFVANQQLAGDLAKAQAAEAAARSAAAAQIAAAAAAAIPVEAPPPGAAIDGPGGPPSGAAVTEYVPYGEAPLANARLDRLRGLAATLEAQHFRGRIRVDTFVGDFCLTGNAGEGYSVADTNLPSQKCDLVGNPFDDALSAAQRQSVDFANFAATLRQRTGGAIVVDAVNAGRRSQLAYPEQGDKATAGEWNTIAAQNNRVEFRVIPAA